MHGKRVGVVGILDNGNGVVQILGVLAVYRENCVATQVNTPFYFLFRYALRHLLRLFAAVLRKIRVQTVTVRYRHHVHVFFVGKAQNLNYFALGTVAVVFGKMQNIYNHLLPVFCVEILFGQNVNVAYEFAFVGNDKTCMIAFIVCAYNLRHSSLQNFYHFRFVLRAGYSAIQHGVTVKSTVRFWSGNKQVSLLTLQKTETTGICVKNGSAEIALFHKTVTAVFVVENYFTVPFQLLQSVCHCTPFRRGMGVQRSAQLF